MTQLSEKARKAALPAEGRAADKENSPSNGAAKPSAVSKPALKKQRYLRRQKDPFTIVQQIKLWPSKNGILHGVRSVKLKSGMIVAETHCGRTMQLRNSRNSRLARHLRNKFYDRPCKKCRIPAWKIDKFSETTFV